MAIRAVIFDLYDTLLYTEESGTRAQAVARLQAHGIMPDDWVRGWRAGLNKAMRGEITTLLGRVRHAFDHIGFHDAPPALVYDICGLMWAREVPVLYEDTIQGLCEVHKRGYKLGLISNVEEHQKHWVFELEIAQYFDALILSCDACMLKPEPEIFLLAAQNLSASPADCVFVGDGLSSELAGAKAVGMKAIRIDREQADKYEARDEAYDFVVHDLNELAAYLES